MTAEQFRSHLDRSRLLAAGQTQLVYTRWLQETPHRESADLFAQWLVKLHHITEYQARLLLKGMADDFFLEDFKILERVGRGRMAGVYKAQRPDGAIVAIKVLPPSRAKIAPLIARFQRESRLALKLHHRHVVRSLHVGETNGLHFLVMEFLDGETLDEVLQRRMRLPPVEAARIVHQALLGLQHLHEQGLVHRDLKPSNLMLTPAHRAGEADTTLSQIVKILDIGLARPLFEGAAGELQESAALTQEGVLLGTPDYLSPEQARDPRSIDIRSDIYSLGCVLYHLLSGQAPFPDVSILKQMMKHANEMPRPIRAFNPAIPDGLQQILNYLMAKQANQRYPTPARAADALQAFILADAADAADAAPENAQPASSAPTKLEPVSWLSESTSKAESAAPASNAPNAPIDVPASAAAKRPKTGDSKTGEGKKPSREVPTAKALKRKSQLHVSRVSEPHVPPPNQAVQLMPVEIELVPIQSVPPREAKPASNSSVDAASTSRERDWLMLGIGAGILALVAAIGIVVTMIFVK